MLAPPPPPAQEGIILPPSRPRNDTAGRIFLLFVDDLHLDFRNTGRIRDLFKRMLRNLIHDGDMFGIVSTGTSSLGIDLTYDRKVLDDAIKQITGSGLKPTDIIEGAESSQGPTELRYRAHVAFSTAYDMLKHLEKLQQPPQGGDLGQQRLRLQPVRGTRGWARIRCFGGRIGPDARRGASRSTSRSTRARSSPTPTWCASWPSVTRAANRANATLYTIDPRGLVAGPDLDEKLDPRGVGNYVRKTQDSLRVLAEETGGIAVVNQNDFDKALKRIDAETSDYYVLGYYSSNPDPLKRTRKIEVKVNKRGLNVWSRTSYSLRQPHSDSKK